MTSVPVSLSSSGPLSRQWLAVARAEDVVNAPVGTRVLGRALVLWRSPSGELVAAPDRCTHSKGDLSKGEVNDGLLACPKHGWTFGDQGRCVFKPSGLPITEKAHLQTYRCAERHGLIWVALAEPDGDITEAPHTNSAAAENFRLAHSEVTEWRSNPIEIVTNVIRQMNSTFDDVSVDVPFTVSGSVRSSDGTQVRRLVTSSPIDSRSSLVSTVIWINSPSADDAGTVSAATADLRTARSDAESLVVALPAVEVAPDDGPVTTSWKQRLQTLFSPSAV